MNSPDRSQMIAPRSGPRSTGARLSGAYRPDFKQASKLIGTNVVDVNDSRVGEIDDLAIDTRHGVIAYAIVDRGSGRDEGQRRVAVPFSILRSRAPGEQILLETDGRILSRLSAADANDYAVLNSSRWANDTHKLFAVQPYWVSPGRAGRTGTGLPRDPDITYEQDIYGYRDSGQDTGTFRSDRPQQQQRSRQDQSMRGDQYEELEFDGYDPDIQYQAPPPGQSMWEREQRGEWEHGQTRRGTPIRPAWRGTADRWTADRGGGSPGEIVRASKLMDANIEGANNETVGDLDDLMVDMNTGGIAYAVIASDDLFSDTLYPVPWSMVQLSGPTDDITLAVNMTESDLANAPSFDADNWPNMASTQWTQRVHSHYGVQPAWTTFYGYTEPGERMRSGQPQFRQTPTPRHQQDEWETDPNRRDMRD
jgi:sporulation protein YlmC with PRC-barrel domain